MKKSFKQLCLNKVIDSCLNVVGDPRATKGQKTLAINLLNRAYAKSGVKVQIISIDELKGEEI
jgi:hypothetical protein